MAPGEITTPHRELPKNIWDGITVGDMITFSNPMDNMRLMQCRKRKGFGKGRSVLIAVKQSVIPKYVVTASSRTSVTVTLSR